MKRMNCFRPEYLCLALMLYHLATVLLSVPLIMQDKMELAVHLYPGLMLLMLVIFFFQRIDGWIYIAMPLMLALAVLPLIGWFFARRSRFKGRKLIVLPSVILLVGNITGYVLMFLAGSVLLWTGRYIYLNVILCIALPVLILVSYKKWRRC